MEERYLASGYEMPRAVKVYLSKTETRNLVEEFYKLNRREVLEIIRKEFIARKFPKAPLNANIDFVNECIYFYTEHYHGSDIRETLKLTEEEDKILKTFIKLDKLMAEVLLKQF